MRARLLARSPDVETYHGEAEAIPLPDASVDAVVCAQAHWWFDPERAYGEIARVIRPGGVFGAIWNTPDSCNALAADLNAIGADIPEPVLGARFSSLEAMSFPHAVTYTHETLLLLVKSRAYFIAAAPKIQQEIEQAVARLAATAPDPFELPYLALLDAQCVSTDQQSQPNHVRVSSGTLEQEGATSPEPLILPAPLTRARARAPRDPSARRVRAARARPAGRAADAAVGRHRRASRACDRRSRCPVRRRSRRASRR